MKKLLPQLENYQLILGSASPRRKNLLQQLGLQFKVKVKSVVEDYPNNLKGAEIAEYLAQLKSGAFKNELSDHQILITGDTIVTLDGKALGKPKDEREARTMLTDLSGRSHEVISSVCLRSTLNTSIFHDATQVSFKQLSSAEIDYYIQNFKPYDKAGAYGIQEWIGMIGVEKMEGSFFTVMGFPVQRFYEELQGFLS